MIDTLFICLVLICIIKPLIHKKEDVDNNFLSLPTFNDTLKSIKTVSTEKEQLTAILKEPIFDSNKIIEYKGKEYKKFEFRPQNFNQFIGQKEAKEKAKVIIAQAKKNIKSHFILSALQGHGKTTYVELLAKQLNAKLIEVVGKQVDEDSLLNIINNINTSREDYIILFIDEIDSMNWKVIKILNPIIEQFKINGKNIKPFIFAGATINKHTLIKNNPDTLDRIGIHIKFVRYNIVEIATILKQYK